MILAATPSAAKEDFIASPWRVDLAAAFAKGHGVVLMSAGAATPCKGGLMTYLSLNTKRAGKEGRRSARGIPQMPINAGIFESNFPDHHGFVFAFGLSPGEYQFEHYIINLVASLSGDPIATFKVEPGKVVYIGELFMTRSCDIRGVAYDVRGSLQRDLAIALAQNPGFEGVEVSTQLMTLEPFRR
jgi:hypothetical protein